MDNNNGLSPLPRKFTFQHQCSDVLISTVTAHWFYVCLITYYRFFRSKCYNPENVLYGVEDKTLKSFKRFRVKRNVFWRHKNTCASVLPLVDWGFRWQFLYWILILIIHVWCSVCVCACVHGCPCLYLHENMRKEASRAWKKKVKCRIVCSHFFLFVSLFYKCMNVIAFVVVAPHVVYFVNLRGV